MSKERYHQIIDEVYDNYRAKVKLSQIPTDLTKEEFVELCKNDITFSVYWGLKLEERELNLEERLKIANNNHNWKSDVKLEYERGIDCNLNALCNIHNIPTRLITITYNDKTIESYE